MLMGYLCLFLPHGLTNEYIFQFLYFSIASIFASRLITNYLSYSFHEDYLTNRNEQTQTFNSIDSLCFQARF